MQLTFPLLFKDDKEISEFINSNNYIVKELNKTIYLVKNEI